MMGHTRMFLVSAREIRKFYNDLDVKQRTEDRYGGIYGVWKPISRARCEELAARSSSRTMSLPSSDGAGDMCTLTIIGGPTVEKKFLGKSERTGRKTDAPARPTAKRGRSRATRGMEATTAPDADCPF